MLVKNSLVIGALFFSSASQAEKIEIKKMESILPKIEQDTLVIFDIDNTILEPTQMLGSDQWYGYRLKFHLDAGLSTDKAIDIALSEWIKVQLKTPVQAVEKSTPKIIKNLQKKNITVMALTARPIELQKATELQLRSVGVDLRGSQVLGARDVDVEGEHPSLFKHGSLFVGPKNNKGEVLVKFLEQINYHPQRIVFIDDKEKHILNVGDALKELKLSYIGFRYGATDKYVADFDKITANTQHRHFEKTGEFLSDEAAKSLTEESKK